MPPRNNPALEAAMAKLIHAVSLTTESLAAFLNCAKIVLGETEHVARGVSPTTSRILSVKEFAKTVGVSPATIYKNCLTGEIPCSRIGKKIVIDADKAMESTKWKKDGSK